MKLTKPYSRRILRYDGDALNAISGILSSLTKSGSGFSLFFSGVYCTTGRTKKTASCEWIGSRVSRVTEEKAFLAGPPRLGSTYELHRNWNEASQQMKV